MNFNKLCAALVLAAAFCTEAKVVTVETSGFGASPDEARINALRDAIMQVTGTELNVEAVSVLQSALHSETENGVGTQTVAVDKASQQSIIENTKGYVEGFRVLSRNKNPDGTYEVMLSVDIDKYDVKGVTDERRSIAVQGIGVEGACRCFGKSLPAARVASGLEEALRTDLVGTRKFAVLKRGDAGVVLEREALRDENVHARERNRLGLGRGADYVISGTIKNFSVEESKRTVKLTGDVLTSRSAMLTAQLDLSFVATDQVKFSKTVTVRLSDKEIGGRNCEEVLALASSRAARVMVHDATRDIYPPMIVSVTGGRFMVNYGNEDLKKGDTFVVNAMGEKIIDPYTKESLGREEVPVAKGRIVDTKPKYSVLELIEGDPALVKTGSVLRPAPEEKKPEPKAAPSKKASLKAKMDEIW